MEKTNNTDKWIVKIVYLLGALLLVVGIIIAIVLIDWDKGSVPVKVAVSGGNGSYIVESDKSNENLYTLTAKPHTGYRVEGWYSESNELISTDNEVIVNQKEHSLVTVKFKKITVLVTYDFQNGSTPVVERYVYNNLYTTPTATNGPFTIRVWSQKPDEEYRAIGGNQGFVSSYTTDITLYALY